MAWDARRTRRRGAPIHHPDRRPNTALLVLDVQNKVVAGAHDRDVVVANIAALVDKARAEKVPVVWVQHSADDVPIGSDG
jgi:nicotinamidase-related amidase